MRFEGPRGGEVRASWASLLRLPITPTVHAALALHSVVQNEGKEEGETHLLLRTSLQGRQGQVKPVGKHTGALCTNKLLGKARWRADGVGGYRC
jgi:hypothetical protein